MWNKRGTKLATATNDNNITIYDVNTGRIQKVLEGHRGIVYKFEFSDDEESLYSCSEDGVLILWGASTGRKTNTSIKHSQGVRSFSLFKGESTLIKVACALNDGSISTWDIGENYLMETIEADPDWTEGGDQMIGWTDRTKNHSGSILCIQFSPNNLFLASGSTDHTCKIWNVFSYFKDPSVVLGEMEETKKCTEALNGYIDVLDDKYNVQVEAGDYLGIKLGEVPIHSGYHADLKFTLTHDGPVLDVKFTKQSDIVITGSTDCTIKLWSTRTGELLFQINTPAPVTNLFCTSFSSNVIGKASQNRIIAACHDRILVFNISSHTKEEELPVYWQQKEIEKGYENEKSVDFKAQDVDFYTKQDPLNEIYSKSRKSVVFDENHQTPFQKHQLQQQQQQQQQEGHIHVDTIKNNPQFSTQALRKIVSHGIVIQKFLKNYITTKFPEIDCNNVLNVLNKYNVPHLQLLRYIVNGSFNADDILSILASKNHLVSDPLAFLIRQGASIFSYMIKEGYSPKSEKGRRDLFNKQDMRNLLVISANKQNGNDKETVKESTMPKVMYGNYVNDYNYESYEPEDDVEEDQEGSFGDFTSMSKYDSRGYKRGNIVHFIPSEQIKLIKDYKSRKEINPIFKRKLVHGHLGAVSYPNFNAHDNIQLDERAHHDIFLMKNSERFNENLKYIPAKSQGRPPLKKEYISSFKKPPVTSLIQRSNTTKIQPNLTTTKETGSLGLFKPEKYLKVRGLDIHFDDKNTKSITQQPFFMRKQGETRMREIIGNSFVTPGNNI